MHTIDKSKLLIERFLRSSKYFERIGMLFWHFQPVEVRGFIDLLVHRKRDVNIEQMLIEKEENSALIFVYLIRFFVNKLYFY